MSSPSTPASSPGRSLGREWRTSTRWSSPGSRAGRMRVTPWPAMLDGKWFDYAAQSMIHAFVAALAIEALLRLWRVRAPDDRLALRLLGLGQPLLVTPALFLLAPQRAAEDF